MSSTAPNPIVVTGRHRVRGILTIAEFVLSAEILGVIYGSLNLFGVITNLINVKTFIKMGIAQDGITMAFLLLSLSDLCLSLCSLVTCACSYLTTAEIRQIVNYAAANDTRLEFLIMVDPMAIGVFSFNVIFIFNTTSILITVYLAVARCLCVVRPLQFRNAITMKKTLITTTCFFLFSLATRVPVLAHMSTPLTYNPIYKAWRRTLMLHSDRERIQDITWFSSSLTMYPTAQLILTVCVIIMARRLKQASVFRSSAAVGNNSTYSKTVKTPQTDFSGTNDGPSISTLNNREARVIQQLVLLTSIFIACNIPKIIRNFATVFEPEFDTGDRKFWLCAIIKCPVRMSSRPEVIRIWRRRGIRSAFSQASVKDLSDMIWHF
ncbi:hypothetical protein EGW08_023396 [Elysia chlorotica]|uniref:G-protein coupled receptors family 1 profile domain-containing protein n=1 Tax=Elysia chlorotica TaxID=188477 RepID=A0A3S0Z7T4_ELYCH|nr:hypothetical protein EGW08_023396 [Elysia chlorotica]